MKRRSILLDLAALIAATVAGFSNIVAYAADDSNVAGQYTLVGMREVGSQLILSENGQFEYGLAYGALDEYAAGTWKRSGNQVTLNTPGEIKAPTFVLKSSEHNSEPVLTVLVVNKDGKGIASIDTAIDIDGKDGTKGYTQTYGYQIEWTGKLPPKGIGLGIKMYGVGPQWFKNLPTGHNHFVFVFEPGDLGKVQFRDQVLQWEGGALVMERNGTRMRYVKQK